MHIAFVIKYNPLAFDGGAEKQVRLLAKALQQRGWRVSFITEASDRPMVEQIGEVWTMPAKSYYTAPTNALKVIKLLRELQPDIVYHRVAGPYTLPSALGAKWADSQFVWATCGTEECYAYKFRYKKKLWTPKGFVRWVLDNVMDWFIKMGGNHSRLIVCQTHTQKKLVNQTFSKVSATVIPNSVEAKELPPVPAVDKHHVLWVGKPANYKQPWLFAQLAQHFAGENISFRMAGIKQASEIWQNAPDSIQSQSMPSNLVCLGYLSKDDLRREYQQASILVCTSHTEGFPNIFLEAWQHGCPVLSTWHDDDQILTKEQTGWYAKDIEDAGHQLRHLLQDLDHLKTVGARGQALVQEQFDLEINAQILHNHLLGLII